MKKILIVFDTKEGYTKKISEFISDELRSKGWFVDIIRPGGREAPFEVNAYDGVVVAAPVHYGKFPKSLRKWIWKHASLLSPLPTAFFSVCLGILQKDKATQEAELKIVTDFFAETKWTPRVFKILPGSLAYTKYNWFKKLLMKRIAKKAGGSVDTTVDHEYTDWSALRQYIQGFSDSLEARS